ncbi:MAG: pitrilysin family protein, partial [Rhodothermales bacterium]|nr:pitrilysin family protein [Rhodothermales bacterium]
MFRGTENISAEEYGDLLKNAGADNNAYTTDDRTVYYTTFSKPDLETVLRLEADRFQHLAYAEPEFRTEALAVLGEYNKNVANPIQKLIERQRDVAFTEHTYKHTTMGFIEDIEAMPDQYDYSRQFFERYYRPETTSVIVVGDVEPEEVFDLVEEYWGGWDPAPVEVPAIPEEPAPTGPLYEHVAWETPTLPWVTVAFRGPAAYGETDLDMRAADVIAAYAFSPSSALYQSLVVEEQVVDQLWAYFPDRRDPHLLTVAARVKDPANAWYVRDRIQQALADLRSDPVDAERLEAIKSNLRYAFAQGLDNAGAVGGALASYVAATGDPDTINEVYRNYERLTPNDVMAAADRYFTDERMVVVTLSHEPLPETGDPTGTVDDLVQKKQRDPLPPGDVMGSGPQNEAGTRAGVTGPFSRSGPPAEPLFETIIEETDAPIVDVRFLFLTGAADDPEGKEGLAELTARMVADAGSGAMTYAEIQRALFPLAAGFSQQVDKEMTAFAGRTHLDNLDRYYAVVSGQLLDPGFREADFERVKSALVNDIRVGLRANNDEELGKEVLYEMVYAGHPYGHLNLGHAEAVEALTLDDVRAFYREHYTQRNLMLGLAGDVPAGFVDRVRADLAAALPEGVITRQAPVTQPDLPEGLEVTLVDKDTRGAAISLGFPIEVTRSHPDFPALWLVRSYFGEHRSSNSYLFQRLREARGMNYGDYAYIEYFPRGMFLQHPDPNLGRQSQLFQIWIRPVPPPQAHFALRAALYELEKLVEEGMTEEDFEATRNFLQKYVAVQTQGQGRRLGYALDSRYYGTPAFADYVREALGDLTLEEVNRVIREHLQAEHVAAVVVTPNAEELADALAEDAPSPMAYNAEKPAALLAEDEVIQQYPLNLDRDDIRIVPVEEVFEGAVFRE